MVPSLSRAELLTGPCKSENRVFSQRLHSMKKYFCPRTRNDVTLTKPKGQIDLNEVYLQARDCCCSELEHISHITLTFKDTGSNFQRVIEHLTGVVLLLPQNFWTGLLTF